MLSFFHKDWSVHDQLRLFRERIAVYSESHKQPISALCGQSAKLLYINIVVCVVRVVH